MDSEDDHCSGNSCWVKQVLMACDLSVALGSDMTGWSVLYPYMTLKACRQQLQHNVRLEVGHDCLIFSADAGLNVFA